MKEEKLTIYKSYLLRIWGNKAGSNWRVMITRVGEAEVPHHFITMDDLIIFLLQEFENNQDPPPENF